jgi:hypothetical protein
MLRWPARAKAAIRALFVPLQDIEVYIEDENDEVFYRTLLKRVSGPQLKIARVISLGNRAAVIAGAQSYRGQKPALFIVDGDLEWVRGLPIPSGTGLHRHNAYCIENLLICHRAVVNLLAQDAVLTEDDAVSALKFDDWIASVEGPLLDLFAAYATAQELNPSLKTVSTGVGVMCSQRKKGRVSALDLTKVSANMTATLAETEKVAGKRRTQKRFAEIRSRISSLPFPLDAVSGKDFVLPLLNFHLQSLGSNTNRRSIRVRLAGMCDEARLADLRNAIRTLRSAA